jgi:hypothetical protein
VAKDGDSLRAPKPARNAAQAASPQQKPSRRQALREFGKPKLTAAIAEDTPIRRTTEAEAVRQLDSTDAARWLRHIENIRQAVAELQALREIGRVTLH